MPTTYRPAPPAASILTELVCADQQQRFRACEAICASVWATGLNSCATPAERVSWEHSYLQYLQQLAEAWSRQKEGARW
jgi:hypothetical protein